MANLLIAAHVITFSASLVIFAGAALAAIVSHKKRRGAQLVGLVLGILGAVTAVLLIAGGGSLQRVCISGIAYIIASMALNMLPSAFASPQNSRQL